MKKTLVFFLIALTILLTSCNEKKEYLDPESGMCDINQYISSLSAREKASFQEETALLLHPLKDGMKQYGKDYEFICDGSYAQVKFRKADCAFEIYIGAGYENYSDSMEFEANDIMEYLAYSQIEKVVFNEKGTTLVDGISIGMTAEEISKKLKADGLQYEQSAGMIATEVDEYGNVVELCIVSGQISDFDYWVVFAGDVLSRVEISKQSRYVTDEKSNLDHGKQIIKEAFSFVSENGLAKFAIEELSYNGIIYSSHYDSWFYSWQFTGGEYEEYEICVEKDTPNRVYVTSLSLGIPLVFWSDGQYVDPMLSFLGKWREHGSKEYIDIKSISKEGIVVFDMYVHKDIHTEDMVLLKDLSVAINDPQRLLDDYLLAGYLGESLDGDAQIFDGNVQSGYYKYAGQDIYLIDLLLLNFDGSVQYLPRGMGGRLGAGPLSLHIPSENTSYIQTSSWGYMENFGRDDPNKDNVLQNKTAAGDSVINKYLNLVYETSDIQYAGLEYRYLYDYTFPVNNTTYHVWESVNEEEPHYLYVDEKNELLIKECELSPVFRHTKELIFKRDIVVSNKSYSQQKFVSLDRKITVDLMEGRITKTDAFVNTVDFPNMYFDSVGKNARIMFFADIGNRFALNGYILFDVTTWGATLHITDSNIPDFDIGVYELNSETFFLDPSIGVIGVPDDDEENQYMDDKVTESGKESKLVIRDFGGKIIGYIYVDDNGKKTAKNFYGKILGYYDPDRDVTTDFYGKIIARGDVVSALLFKE